MIRKRDHIIEVLYNAIRFIRKSIFFVFSSIVAAVTTFMEFPLLAIGIIIVFSIIVFGVSFLQWYRKTFEIEGDRIRIKEGVIQIRENDIVKTRVQSFSLSDTLLKRLFKIQNFSLELIGGENVTFVLADNEIADIQKLIFDDDSNHYAQTDHSSTYKINQWYTWLLAFDFKTLAAAVSGTFLILSQVYPLIESLSGVRRAPPTLEPPSLPAKEISELTSTEWLLLVYILGFIVVTSWFVSIVIAYLKYRNFKVIRKPYGLIIQSGIWEKKTFDVPFKKIRSIQMIEPIYLRLFGFAQIKIDNIGMDNNVLFLTPIIKKAEIRALIKEFIPHLYIEEDLNYDRPPKALLPYALLYCLFLSLVGGFGVHLLALIFSKWCYLLLATIPIIFLITLNIWRYQAVAMTDEVVVLQYYKWGKRYQLYILKEYIQTTGNIQTYVQRKVGLYTYYMAVYSEQQTEVYYCKNLSR